MMLNIKTGYGGVKQVPNDEILIFVSSLHHASAQGVTFVFTNQHAYPPMAEYFTSGTDLHRIDWPLLQSRNSSMTRTIREKRSDTKPKRYSGSMYPLTLCWASAAAPIKHSGTFRMRSNAAALTSRLAFSKAGIFND